MRLRLWELAEPFGLTLNGVKKHVRVLEHAGLVQRSRTAQWRPCKLDASPLKEVSDWAEFYRRFWDESFQRLDDVLQDLLKKEKDR